MVKANNWETEAQREAPYWVEGMTPEEYNSEREYYLKHYEEIRCGEMEYKPRKTYLEAGHQT